MAAPDESPGAGSPRLAAAPRIAATIAGAATVAIAGLAYSPRTGASIGVSGAEIPSVVGTVVRGMAAPGLLAHICVLQSDAAGTFCNAGGTRYSRHAAGLERAAAYIENRLAAMGLATARELFVLPAQGAEPAVTIPNVVAELPGVAPPDRRLIYVLAAHYDSTGVSAPGWTGAGPAPGADDNGTGIATVLEAVRLLSASRYANTIRVAFFAGEEQGSHGSRDYVARAQARGDNVAGAMVVDMIGYNGDGYPAFELHAGTIAGSLAIADAITRTIGDYGLAAVAHVATANAMGRSDHESFWHAGVPAVLLIEDAELPPTVDWNPYYHTLEDTVDHVDAAYLSAVAGAAAGAMARLAKPMAPDLTVEAVAPTATLPGGSITRTIRYRNVGSVTASDLMLTDTTPVGLTWSSDSTGVRPSGGAAAPLVWRLGDLPPSSSRTVVVTSTIARGLPEGTVLLGQVDIGAATLDADGADNQTTWRTTLEPAARLHLPYAGRSADGRARSAAGID